MKKVAAILSLVLMSSTVFAAEAAIKIERDFLCKAVNATLELNSVDAALADDACSKNSATIVSVLVTEGIRSVSGNLKFNSPSRTGFTLTCSASYYGKATLDNVVGGIEAVSCK